MNYGTATCIIQARVGATRLPGKILLALAGKPMLWHVVKRVGKAKKINKIVVATTTNPEDSQVEEMCKTIGVSCVRGSVDNVLKRYSDAAALFPGEIIVRIPADKPLIDPGIIDLCVGKLEEGGYDYASNIHPPEKNDSPFLQGIAVEVFRLEVFKKAAGAARQDYEKEHVTPYIWENKNNEFKNLKIIHPPEIVPKYRFTVDYPEDFALVSEIYKALYKENEIVDIKEACQFLDKHPEIAKINTYCEQKNYK